MRRVCSRLQKREKSGCVRAPASHSAEIAKLAKRCAAEFANGLGCVRTLFFDKNEKSNWPVAWHQDTSIAVKARKQVPGYENWTIKDGINHVRPPISLLESMRTVRIHLDRADENNAALLVVPGSHRRGFIESGSITRYSGRTVVCTCDTGAVLVMSPLVLHSSNRSVEPSHRRVLHFEYARRDMLHSDLEWMY